MLSLLTGTAQDIGSAGFDDFSGWGLVNALDAVIGATPVLTLSAHEVDLGETGSHTLVQAQNTGGGVLSLGTLTPSAILGGTTSWLQITPASDGKTIQLDADRSGLVDGDYQVQVDVVTNGGNDSFLVDLTTNSARLMPQDVGTVTIQLFASDNLTLVTSTTATAANGYAFHLPKVPVGKYFLRAGTDLNGNGVLGEPGELFGAYPRGAAPQVLELDKLNDFKVDLVVK
jgi:serine protease